MIYLASPYSHPSSIVREQRFRDVCAAAAKLIAQGKPVFSPIAHSHCIAQHGLPNDWTFWEPIDRWHIERCDELIVLMLDGWRTSLGMAAEIEMAVVLGKPISYLDPADL